MPSLKIGDTNLFTVTQKNDHGYVLKHTEAMVPMLFEETKESLAVGDQVEAFVYINHQKGLAAATIAPYIDQYRAGYVKVVEKKEGLGVFVDVGLKKDMLVSKDDLPHVKKHWPTVNDELFCYLKTARRQMVARPVSRFRMLEFNRPETPLEEGAQVEAIVHRHADEGVVLFTRSGHEIFVYYKHTRKSHRLGEVVSVQITVKKDDLHYNGTLIEQKETMMDDDANRIYEYLKMHGTMSLTDKSHPDEIFEIFHMSKAAFKRALGRLYKSELVELDKTETRIKK